MNPIPTLDTLQRILIVKTSSIGDVIHALPVVEAIKRARPSLDIGWVVRRKSATVLVGNPNIAHCYILPDRPSWGDLTALRRTLRAARYEVALDMQGLFLSGLITRLSGAPVRIGIDRNREGNRWFLTHPTVPGKLGGPHGDRHAVDILYGFAEALGIGGEHPEFEAQGYLRAGPEAISAALDAARRPLIGMSVGASWETKRWPMRHWIELANALAAAGFGLLFVGDRKDAETVAQVKAGLANPGAVVDLSGKTDLRELAAALGGCDLLVTADSGPLHLAVAVGTPVVALFGATSPARTGPYGRRNTVLDLHLACSPCFRRPTCQGRIDCMVGITPTMVLEAVRERLAAPAGTGS